MPHLVRNVFFISSVSCASYYEAHLSEDIVSFKVPPEVIVEHHTWKIDYEQEHYDFWLRYFTQRNKERERFQRHLNNGDKFRNIVESILASYDLPLDLYFIGPYRKWL